MEKNVAGKWIVFAYGLPDHATLAGQPITGDAAQITAEISKDGAAGVALGDTNPVELEDGYYVFDITAAEANADLLLLLPESSTANVQVIGVPGALHTRPANFNALGIASDGDISGNVDGNVVGSVASVTGAVGSVTGSVGSVTGAVGSVTAAVTLPSIPTDWITAAGINTGALTADAFAADALVAATFAASSLNGKGDWNTTTPPTVNAIADQVWEEAIADHSGTSGSTAEALNAAGSAGDPWTTMIPGSYSAGQAGNILGNLNDPAASAIADAVWDEAQSGHTTAGTFGKFLDTEVSGVGGGSASDIADAVWDEARSGHTGAGSFGETMGTVESNIDNLDAAVSNIPTSNPSAVAIRTEMDSNSTKLADIVADTNELQVDWADAGRLDTILDAIKTVVDALAVSMEGLVIHETTIDIVTSQTVFTLNEGSPTDDTYKGLLMSFETSNGMTLQYISGDLGSYVGSTKQITLIGGPPEAIANGDRVQILSTAAAMAPILTTVLTVSFPTLSAQIAALNDLSAAQVNAEMVDVLNVDTWSELTSIPGASATITEMLRLLFAAYRNKQTQTSSLQTLRNDADDGNIGTRAITTDGSTTTLNELS